MKKHLTLAIIMLTLLISFGCTLETPSQEEPVSTETATTEETDSTTTVELLETTDESTPNTSLSTPEQSQSITEETASTTTEDQPKMTDESTPSTSSSTPEQSQPTTPEEVKQETETTESTPTFVFSASPIDIGNILSIVPLGNLNPPSHVFPTDHIYFYISRQEGGDRTKEVALYSPGNLIATSVNAIEHVKAGIVDYNINFVQGNSLHVRLGHVSSLSEDIFGDTSSFKNWEMTNEYSTGGETYRWWSKEYDSVVVAGQVIGTAGGNPNQWALDLFVYDLERTQRNVANPERWSQSWYLHGVDPLSYYEDGALFEQLLRLIDREMSEEEQPPFGSVLQDLPGTAQGCWFLQGVTETYPEDPHGALVHDNIRPRFAVLSIGNTVRNLQADVYEFLPREGGVLNRDFGDITPDGKTYGFEVERFNGVIIIHMPDSETLWMEALPGVSIDPDQWIFSADRTVFNR